MPKFSDLDLNAMKTRLAAKDEELKTTLANSMDKFLADLKQNNERISAIHADCKKKLDAIQNELDKFDKETNFAFRK